MLTEYAQRFLSSEVPARPAEKCLFHVVPVPLEATVSYAGGTAGGPAAILDASDQLELLLADGSAPGEKGIFTHPPVDCAAAPEIVMERIAAATRAALDAGGLPVLLGGEHSLTYGALKALKERHGTFGVIQFDAHADLRDSYEGSKWSHACVMRRAVADLGLPLAQFGNRIFCREELQARKDFGVISWDAPVLLRHPLPASLLPESFPQRVFITFDVDGLDPSVIEETGTPVPGGLGWYQALDLAENALRGRTLLGFDVVELAPRSGKIASDFAAALLTYSLMGMALRPPCDFPHPL